MKHGPKAKKGSIPQRAEDALRDYALGFPEAYEEFPWGERALKVKKKIFLFLGCSANGLSLSVKLPESSFEALLLPFTEPTGYGLGKSGWVSASFGAEDQPPLEVIRRWVDESYRSIAPKKLVALLDGDGESAPKKKPASAKKTLRKKP